MKEPIKILTEELCVFTSQPMNGAPRCGYANHLLCSKKYAMESCRTFKWFMDTERARFAREQLHWNRNEDGSISVNHGLDEFLQV